MLQDLVQHLSPESRYFRFVSSITELPPTMLARFTLIDYDREMALVAVFKERTRVQMARSPRPSASSACRATSPTPTSPAANSRWWWPTTSMARAWARA
jgi:hypothetical protein